MRKPALYALLFVVLAAITLFSYKINSTITDLSNPLRRPEEQIRESILELTPIGTSISDVAKLVEKHENWRSIKGNSTYRHLYDSNSHLNYIFPELEISNDKNTIGVDIGRYQHSFAAVASVVVFWQFDENCKLINICLYKDTFNYESVDL